MFSLNGSFFWAIEKIDATEKKKQQEDKGKKYWRCKKKMIHRIIIIKILIDWQEKQPYISYYYSELCKEIVPSWCVSGLVASAFIEWFISPIENDPFAIKSDAGITSIVRVKGSKRRILFEYLPLKNRSSKSVIISGSVNEISFTSIAVIAPMKDMP